MNRNTIVAFVLLLGVVMFFTSPWYNENILGIKKEAAAPETKTAAQGQPAAAPAVAAPSASAGAATVAGSGTAGVGSAAGPMMLEASKTFTPETVWVKTDKFVCGISETGARIVSLRTREYRYRQSSIKTDSAAMRDPQIEILQIENNLGAANLTVGAANMDGERFEYCGIGRRIEVAGGDSAVVRMRHVASSGDTLYKVFTFRGEGHLVGLRVQWPRMSGQPIRIGWDCGMRESELHGTAQSTQQYAKVVVHHPEGRAVAHLEFKNQRELEEKRPPSGNYGWLALTTKYFLVALIPDSIRSTDISLSIHKEVVHKGTKQSDFYNYGIGMTRTAESNNETYNIYVGPSKINELRKLGIGLDGVLFSGWKWFLWANIWFPFICEYLLIILLWVNGVVHDYGITILLMTVLVKVITYPLSLSSMRSMSKMKVVQPEVTKIREKYKNNPTKMNQAIMALYKDNGINPLNPGCLPMLLQMPVLIALYVVLMKAIEMRGAPTIIVPWVKDLSQPEVLFRLPFTLPWYGDNFALIPLIMAAVTFVQNKMTMKDPSQKAMVYIMPIFMFVLFNGFPAGLVIYWTFSSILGILQQYLIEKSMPKAAPVVVTEGKKSGSKQRR